MSLPVYGRKRETSRLLSSSGLLGTTLEVEEFIQLSGLGNRWRVTVTLAECPRSTSVELCILYGWAEFKGSPFLCLPSG